MLKHYDERVAELFKNFDESVLDHLFEQQNNDEDKE